MRAGPFCCILLQLLSLSAAASTASFAARCTCFFKLSSGGVSSQDQVPFQQPGGGGGLRCSAAEPGLLRCRWRTTPCGRSRRPPGLHCFGNGSKRGNIGETVVEEEREARRVLDASQHYLACMFGTCGRACAFCAHVQPGVGIGVSLRAVEYSPFLVGIEWRRLISFSSLTSALRRRRTSTRKYHLGLTTCWSTHHLPCTFRCTPEEPVTLVGSEGSFSVPADLYSGSVQLRVRSLGRGRREAAVFKAFFRGKQVEPSRPCDVTVKTVGLSVQRLRWKVCPHARLDGFQVSWCRIDSGLPRACSSLYLPHDVSSVTLKGIMPFFRYRYQVRAYRGDPNVSDVLLSPPSTASRIDRLGFELFLFVEELVIFLLAGAVTLAALLTVGFTLTRAFGLRALLDMEPAPLVGVRENQAQGDHRRHLPAGRRLWAAALPRVRSRGDS